MIKNRSELEKKCAELPLSKADSVVAEIASSTNAELKKLLGEFSPAEVFSTLAKLWPCEKAAAFFGKASCFRNHDRMIRTIATSYYRAYNGGAELVNAELMDLWIKMGFNVVFFTDEPENSSDYPYPDKVKRIVIPSLNNISERLSSLQKICEDEEVDVFINHNWTDPRSLWECVLMKTMGIGYVQYCHSFFAGPFANGKPALVQPDAFRLCDLIIALSETNARFYQLCGCRTYLVQNPISDELKESASVAALDSDRILFIGRISEEKDPMDALQIFKMVLESGTNARFDIVGSGDDDLLARMKEFVAANDLGKSVFFHGHKSFEEIKDFYKNAACVMMTSKMEGYPMVVLESKAFGLPLVMYELPYLSMLQDKKGVLSASAGEKRKMADHLIRVLEDDGYRKKLGAEARESFETFVGYDLEGVWKDILGICSGDSVTSDVYFSPEDLSEADKQVMPALFDKLKVGFDYTFTSSRDYRLGASLLRIPREVKKLVRKVREAVYR